MGRKGINAFLEARKVAVVGASENNLFSVSLLRNLGAFDFPNDDLYLINPRRKEALGRTCWPDLSDVPAPVDLAMLLVSRERVPEALRSCLEKRVPAAVIVASGFAERDSRGKDLQEEIQRLGGGIEIMGPNSSEQIDAHWFEFFSSAQCPLRPGIWKGTSSHQGLSRVCGTSRQVYAIVSVTDYPACHNRA